MSVVHKFINGPLNKLQTKVFRKINSIAVKSRKKSSDDKKVIVLPKEIWAKIISYSSIRDLLKLRRVCKQFDGIVNEILSNTIYMDVYKIDSEKFIAAIDSRDIIAVSPRTRFVVQVQARRVTIVMEERCTARDMTAIFGAVSYFGRFVRIATVDASVFELMIAGLSSMDLTRWHAFQCYLKAFNHSNLEDSVHIHCVKSNTHTVLLPKLTELTICVSPDEFSCLSRFMDYGVSSSSVYSSSNLCLLRLNLPTTRSTTCNSKESRYLRRCNQHIRSFKHWSDVPSLQEKYCQKYS